MVLLVDTNAAGAKGMPRPHSIGSQDASECAAIVQRYDCIARLVDHARIAANDLAVLQVCFLDSISASGSLSHNSSAYSRAAAIVMKLKEQTVTPVGLQLVQ